jgi:integrase
MDKLPIYKVDKFLVGKYYEHIETTTKSAASFNHNLRALKSFYNFLINIKEYAIPNPVSSIKMRYENPDPRSVDDDEFRKLLSVVTEENSKEIYESGNRRHSLNRYKPFIKDSFELAAYTGMRLEEVAILKYSDVVEDATGKLLYLKGTDLKFQRAHNWDNTKPNKIVYIPITPELEDLLNRLNYKQNKGVDRHLIDGDCTMSRKSLVKQMSHSFSFFRKKAGLPDNFSIKHLRKTFLTKLETQTNMSSAAGYQKTPNVILKHYIDKKVVVKEIEQRGFSYFKSNN